MFDLGTFYLKWWQNTHNENYKHRDKQAPGMGWWETWKFSKILRKFILELLHKLLEALKVKTHLALARHWQGHKGCTINAPRYTCSRLPSSWHPQKLRLGNNIMSRTLLRFFWETSCSLFCRVLTTEGLKPKSWEVLLSVPETKSD